MKTEMSEDGVISIRPESSVEAYALRRWMEIQRIDDGDGAVSVGTLDSSKLLIDASWPRNGRNQLESPRGILDYLGEKP